MSYSPARIEIWNLEEDVTFPCLGSQRIFNITGRIDYPITEIKNFYYVLNNYKSMPIPQGPDCGRLVNEGDFNILVENDGKGFDKTAIKRKEGQHLGLTIMQERARHLGGKLKIESEPDEGTRIELQFNYQGEQITI